MHPDDITALSAAWAKSSPFEPFKYSAGSQKAKIAVVGEAWGDNEAKFKHPFVGAAGLELARMMGESGLTQPFIFPRYANRETYLMGHWATSGLFLTNVFCEHPPGNKLDDWCLSKKEVGPDYHMPYLKSGKYIHPMFFPHLERLVAELKAVQPNLIIALGNTACWALMHQTAITKIRGAIAWSKVAKCKILPTFHPSNVLQTWSNRPIVLQDFMKAAREGKFPEIRRPERQVTINPTIDDIYHWALRPAEIYSVDIETSKGQITMIGFARSPQDAIVIPFIKGDGTSYWASHEDEVRAWTMVKEMLERPLPKLFQNGLFDLSYIVRLGIRPRNCIEDTMLLHHSLFPEMKKGLEFLGSIYTDEASWKMMRSHNTSNKREE